MNIKYEMTEHGAEIYDGDELVMEISWDDDAADEYAWHYDLRGFSVYHPSYSESSTIDYGEVLIAPPSGTPDTLERAVYCDGEYVGHARCRWLMYDVALMLERYYELKNA